MAEKYRFFDSIDGEDERHYTADEFAEYFRQFIRNGIFTGGENLQVGTSSQDMKVFIKPGYAWVEGYLYKIEGEPLAVEHEIADPSLNRIDRVVIRLDKTLENRYVKAFVLKGEPGDSPKPPALTRDANVYELSLAQVEIIAGKSFIEAHQINDERLHPQVCGLVTHLFEQVDTTAIFLEWQAYLEHKKSLGDEHLGDWQDYLSEKESDTDLEFQTFIQNLQAKLAIFQQIWADWVEEKIKEPGGEFYEAWQSWFNEIKEVTNLVTQTEFAQLIQLSPTTPASFHEHTLWLQDVGEAPSLGGGGVDFFNAQTSTTPPEDEDSLWFKPI